MASLSRSADGKYVVQFVDVDGKRKSVRLGGVDKRTAHATKLRIEALLAAKVQNVPIDRDTAQWLTGIGAELSGRLAAVGLIEPRVAGVSVAAFLTQWLQKKKDAGYKPTSIRAWTQTADGLAGIIGSKAIPDVTHEDGEAFRASMQEKGMRPTTIQKRLGHARAFFEDAIRFGHIQANPFRHVKHRGGDVSERRAYVSVEDIEKVLDACFTDDWRLLIALARFGGLRVPSEAFSMKWEQIDLVRGRMTVPSPKTEHLGKPDRIVPIFPLLRPHLERSYEQRGDDEFVFPLAWRQRSEGEDGWGGANMRTALAKIVRRAGLEPWSRIWHSLRASCESDLAGSFPLPTVTKWLGNTPSVAMRHYVDPTEDAFDRAVVWTPPGSAAKSGAERCSLVQKAVQSVSDARGLEGTQPLDMQGISPLESSTVPICHIKERECMGIEPTGSVVHTAHWF